MSSIIKNRRVIVVTEVNIFTGEQGEIKSFTSLKKLCKEYNMVKKAQNVIGKGLRNNQGRIEYHELKIYRVNLY